MECPVCGSEQSGKECLSCGIIFSKYKKPKDIQEIEYDKRMEQRGRYSLIFSISKYCFLFSILFYLICVYVETKFPDADFYDKSVLKNPVQYKTDKKPFFVKEGGINYFINPKYEYSLEGVVVSFHNTHAWWDVYHKSSWKDYINIKDLCVIWGANVSSEIYKKIHFSSGSWTCYVQWDDYETGRIFSMSSLSNNHILSSSKSIKKLLKDVSIGDHIKFNGYLSEYSHDQGFFRGTSVTRFDTGNGACETVFLSDFEIIKKAHPFAFYLKSLFGYFIFISIFGMIFAFLKTPVNL